MPTTYQYSADRAKHEMTSSFAEGAALRRVPTQQRSVQRVARMLDASADLLDEIGYERLSTTLIAQRAQVAIGSVYQFFGDKRAVVRALTLRYLDGYLTRVVQQVNEERPSHWWQLVDNLIDTYVEMQRTVPGFRTLHFGNMIDENLLDHSRTNSSVLVARLSELARQCFDVSDSTDLDLLLTVAVETGDALIKLAFRDDPHGDTGLLQETKIMLRRYLELRVSQM